MAQPSGTSAHESLQRFHLGPVEMHTELGKPIVIGERRLTPVVRVTSFVRRKGVVGTRRLSGWGMGAVHLQPVAVLETTTAGTRRIPVHDRTGKIILGFLAAALALPILLTLLVRLINWLRK
ncbi:MAG: hypothetical protein NUW24_07370 [Anaerolineae bacterium]|nr:hypothetical protein [Anaerolineae bacterium]MDH7474058.1 hypothetical protein [Anaerolineae bacterium]